MGILPSMLDSTVVAVDTTVEGWLVSPSMDDFEGLTTAALLRRSAIAAPDRTAIIWGDTRLSYRELDRAANRCANALIAVGINKGDIVAILSGNRPEYAIAQFGAARAGAVAAHVPNRFMAEEMDYALRWVGARAIVHEASFTGLAPLEHAFIIGDSFEIAMAEAPEIDPEVVVSASDPGSIIYTGGTTGLPKAVLHTHGARIHWSRVAINDFGLDADEVAVVAAPMYHAAGGFIWFQPTIAAGGTAVLLSGWDVPAFIETIATQSATGAFLVPTQIALLLDHPAFDPARLTSLRKVVYGASPVPAGLIERAREALPGAAFIQNFGQSETGPLITLLPELWALRPGRPDTLGRASPLVEVAIFTEPGKRAPVGEIGEVAARGPNLMTGYVSDPEATATFFKAGDDWGYTGDLACADAEGVITLVDRLKDMFIAGGVNIYPGEIERVANDHPAIADCAAVGLPDATWGETPALAVVPAEGADAAAVTGDLETFCAARLSSHKCPRRVEIVAAIPRTPTGKIQRSLVRDFFA